MKRKVAMLLAVMMLFTSGGEILAAELADNNQKVTVRTNGKTLPTGLMEPEVIAIPEEEMPEEVYDCEEIVSINRYSAIYNDDWDKYSTNYYYNQLSADEKTLWDAMDALCIYYLNNNVTIKDSKLDLISISFDITKEELIDIWQIFMYSNPQYYFLVPGFSYSYNPSTNMMTGIMLKCYDAFSDGTARATATKNMQAQADAWEKILAGYSDDKEKLQAVFELICEKVTYNHDLVDGLVTEQECFSQSAYSVFCTDTTVCAGYADAMTMMCNAVGLDAVSVTSYNHQWNKVRIDDNWYNYDATWGDGDSYGIYFDYYARSDEWYAENDSSHVEEEFWNEYSPNALIDVEPKNLYEPGTYPVITSKTVTPSISVVRDSGGYIVSFSSQTPNATIYYTLDGTDPSAAFTRATEYKAPFYVENTCTIKAMAVCDGCLDSSIQTSSVDVKTYTITYVLNGGVNNSKNPTTYSELTDKFELYPATRDGYTFDGWYYDSSFTKSVSSISGSIGNVTVYAKWSKIVEPLEDAEVTLSKTKYTYDGKAKKPTVSVTLDGKTLEKDTDYTVEYKDNKNIGKATVTITGIGNYSGTITKKFTISLEKGDTFTSGKYKYKVTGSSTVAFNGIKSTSTTKVTIPDTVTYGGKTFKVTAIADSALKNKTKVTSVTIGENVTKIGKNAFSGCKALKTIVVNCTELKSVGKNAFKGIYAKATIKVPAKEYSSYKELLSSKGQGKNVTIQPQTGAAFTQSGLKYKVTGVSSVAFIGISSEKTTKVSIPKTVKYGGKTYKVTSIADNALKNKTKVTSVTIGANVTKIGKNAFYGCSKLKTITIKSTKLESVGKQALKGINSKATIKVPESKLKSYKTLLKGKEQGSKVTIVKMK